MTERGKCWKCNRVVRIKDDGNTYQHMILPMPWQTTLGFPCPASGQKPATPPPAPQEQPR